MMGSMDAKRISWNRNQKDYQEFLQQSKGLWDKWGTKGKQWALDGRSRNLWSSASTTVCTQRASNCKMKEKSRVSTTNFHWSSHHWEWLTDQTKKMVTLSSGFYTAQTGFYSANKCTVLLGVCLHFINGNEEMSIHTNLLSHPGPHLKKNGHKGFMDFNGPA